MVPNPDAADWLTAATRDVRRIYDSRFIQSLCANFPPMRAPGLIVIQDSLICAGAIYLARPATNAAPAEWRARQDQLGRLLQSADELARQLNGLSPHVRELLSRSEREGDFLAMVRAVQSRVEPTAHADGRPLVVGETNLLAGAGSLPNGLEALRGVIDRSLRSIQRARPKGAPRNDALRTWVFNMEQVWTQHFGRRFTLSQKDGPSPALQFCTAVMAPLDPTVEQGAIANKMAEVIRHYRQIENRRKAGQSAGG